MLNNNIKILLVSFVHHIELQNFLNAPRRSCGYGYNAMNNDITTTVLIHDCLTQHKSVIVCSTHHNFLSEYWTLGRSFESNLYFQPVVHVQC